MEGVNQLPHNVRTLVNVTMYPNTTIILKRGEQEKISKCS
jgi:hypothetical protein